MVDLNVNKGFHKLAFNPDGKFLATGDSDGYVRLWSYSGKLLTKFKAFTTKDEQDTIFMNIAFSPNGKFLATSDSNRFDKIVRVWDTSGKKLAELNLNGTDFTFSSDSKIVATRVYNDDTKSGTTWLWDTSGKKLAELNGTGFTFSSDSKIVATRVYNDDTKSGTTWLWDTSGKKLAELNGTGLTLFTPDNKLITTTGRKAYLWNISGERLNEFDNLTAFSHLVFSHNGKLLADGSIRLWDVYGDFLGQVKRYGDSSKMIFSTDNKQVIAVVTLDDKFGILSLPVQELDKLISMNCEWIRNYLNTKPKDDPDRYICNNINNYK